MTPISLAEARAVRARLQTSDRGTPLDTARTIADVKREADRLDRDSRKLGGLTETELAAAVERLQHLIDRLCP